MVHVILCTCGISIPLHDQKWKSGEFFRFDGLKNEPLPKNEGGNAICFECGAEIPSFEVYDAPRKNAGLIPSIDNIGKESQEKYRKMEPKRASARMRINQNEAIRLENNRILSENQKKIREEEEKKLLEEKEKQKKLLEEEKKE